MGNFFYALYRYFSRHRILLWTLFFLILGGSALLVSRLRMDEQITRKSSGKETRAKMQNVASAIGLTDNLIIRISPSDTTVPADPALLTSFAAALSDSLLSAFDSTYIASVTPDPSDTGFLWLSELMTRKLPLWLEEEDYRRLDSLLTPASIRQAMEGNYRLLSTPAGMMMRERIQCDPLGISGAAMGKLRTLQADENYTILDGYVFTKDERNLLLFLASANPSGETDKNGRLIRGIERQVSALKAHYPGVDAELWGGVAMAVGNAIQLKKDITLTLSLAIGLIFLLLALYFRNVWVPLVSFVPAVFGGTVALALFYLFRGTISAISLGIGAVLLGLIVDYALYVINRYRECGSVETVMKEMSQSIFLCALTSVGAFLCLLFLDSGVLFDLGLFAALSLAFAALFALVFLPHMLNRRLVQSRTGEGKNLVDRFCSIRFEKKKWILIGIAVACVVSLVYYGRVRFEDDMNALNFVSPGLKAAGDRLERISEVGLKSVYVVAEADSLDEALAAASACVPEIRSLREQGIVRSTSGVQAILPSGAEQQKRLDRWRRYWTPEKVQFVSDEISASAQALGMKPSAFDSFISLVHDPGEGLTEAEIRTMTSALLKNWVSRSDGKTWVTTVLKVPEAKRRSVYDALAGMKGITVFDRQELTKQFVESVQSDFDRLVMLNMIFVTLLLILSFGRIETGLVTAIPMFLSWLLTLGFMGLADIRFNIFNIIISSFIFGLGDDYNILMMRGLLLKYKYGRDDTANYKVSIFLSSATTIIGVAVLLFAKHPALNSIALIAVFGIASVILITFAVEPLIMKWMLFDRQQKKAAPLYGRSFLHSIFIAWIPITTIAFMLVCHAVLISPILPVSRKKKQKLFHRLFSILSRGYIAINFPGYHKIEDETGDEFRKPAIIIANHQSLIETPALLRLHRDILIFTNEWIFHHWVFGPVARAAGFIPIRKGIDDAMEVVRAKMEEGYSVLIFPEGSRSPDGRIRRFHRGAFYLAEKLQADIQPVLIFGSGDFLRKTDFWGNPNRLFMKVMQRITPGNGDYGTTYQERARNIRRMYEEKYAEFRHRHGTPSYYRHAVIRNYLYKGPVLEWYVKVKLSLEDNFRLYHEHLPMKGNILDLGCGYGYVPLMLSYLSDQRNITGIDHDEEKISVAENCHGKGANLHFATADVTGYPFGLQDGIILGDVLHYLEQDQQTALLDRCLDRLAPGGVLLIREGLKQDDSRHRRTRLTEFFSTRTGFNKTTGPSKSLHFIPLSAIREIVEKRGFELSVVVEKKKTSNTLLKVMRPARG